MAIDQSKVIQSVHGLKLEGDSNGLIRRFGVLLNNNNVDYYNDFSFEFERAIIDSHGADFAPIARELLVYAAQDCADNTFFGIMSSDEYKGLVAPMIESEEDKVKGLVAVENALGWARVEFAELEPGEKLVLRSRGGYEEEGYRKRYGKSDHGVCYMLAGVTAGFMDLLYGPGIGPENLGTYKCEEVKCIAKGDDCCEFVATKR
jgi:hypothetical protein